MGLFVYTQKGSIISTVVLPTTEIIEPKKMSTPENLKNYQAILSGLEGSIQTDLSLETIMSLVNTQLESGTQFTVESQALTGTGRSDLSSYAMPGSQLYMMEINQDSLEQAKAAIQSVLV
ncbi:hypothetical protein HO801_05490 [Streptococcus suis]|nr:hypothetical protein [Streptococcus suis]